MTMRLKLYTLLCISFLLIFTACNQDDDPVPAEKVTRTVLAYIMADNSLSGFASIDIDEMMKGRTTFIVAHRLSTIKNADQIIVMDQGHIVEIGNHEELLQKQGYYHQLYYSQFETE